MLLSDMVLRMFAGVVFCVDHHDDVVSRATIVTISVPFRLMIP